MYKYKFFYKDKLGVLKSHIVEVDKLDCELAIAKFEYIFPDQVWRRFETVK
jgi:hypothetical protein